MLSEAGHWMFWFWTCWKGLWCRPMLEVAYDWPSATYLELQISHSLWLPLLGLNACGKDQAVHQGWLLPAPGPEAGQPKSQGTLRSTFTCLHLPATSKSQSLKELLAVLLSRVLAPQGGVKGNPEGGAIASLHTDAAWLGVLHPGKMASVVWESDSAQGSWQPSLQLPSQSYKPQTLLM